MGGKEENETGVFPPLDSFHKDIYGLFSSECLNSGVEGAGGKKRKREGWGREGMELALEAPPSQSQEFLPEPHFKHPDKLRICPSWEDQNYSCSQELKG